MRWFGISLCLLLLTLTGCQVVRPPTASVESVRLVEVTDEGARYVVRVNIRNPNDFELPLHHATLNLRVAQVGTYAFDQPPHAALPARGEQQVQLAAAISTDKGLDAAGRFSVSGVVTYQPPGEVRKVLIDSGVPRPRVFYSGAGDIEIAIPTARTAP